jgi:hypothetical protein
MAISKIRTVPTELPHARLYLDDVEELSRILLDAFRNPKKPIYAQPGDPPQALRFLIGDDLQIDTVDDLRQRGGSASSFQIAVTVGIIGSSISIQGFIPPTLRLSPELDVSEQWAVYSKVRAVFETRELVLKNAILSLPGWLRWSLVAFSWLGIFPVMELLKARSFWYLLWSGMVGFILFVMFRPSRVYFVDFHERSKLLAADRKSWFRAIALLALGAAIPKLVEYLAKHWSK